MPRPSIDEGFKAADGRNLPSVSSITLATYFHSATFLAPEMKNVKTLRSGRSSYGEEAIGFVQVKRDQEICHVKALITPEHRIQAPNYHVHCIINEKEEKVLKAHCDDCAARAGGCKHAIAFITWLHRRTLDPAVTDRECYWKRSQLSLTGKDKCVPVEKMISKVKVPTISSSCVSQFQANVRDQLKDIGSTSIIHAQFSIKKSISIHHLVQEFSCQNNNDFQSFLDFCKVKMTEADCAAVKTGTTTQSESYLWYEYRYGRVTASKIFEASRCTTANGTLVSVILGASKVRDTVAMERGRKLEKSILKVLENKYKQPIAPSGLVLKKEYPIFGASPDGVMGDYIVEIKSPMSDKTFNTYFQNDQPSPKYHAQMMMQMLMCDKNKGIFCVAHPDYEESGAVKCVEVLFDSAVCTKLLQEAGAFWEKCIFPKLMQNSTSYFSRNP